MSNLNIEESGGQTPQPAFNFLGGLWRSPDRCHFLATRGGASSGFRHHPTQSCTQAAAIAHEHDSQGHDCYHACAEFSASTSRTAENAVGAWAFWIDVDCGAEKAANKKGYATQDEAKSALIAVTDRLKLPMPNCIVSSGSGLHCYWVLDQFVEKKDWRETADQLKSLLQREGFLADPSRTADIASLLRIPGTHNRKGSVPLPVVVLTGQDQYLSREDFRAAVAREHTRGLVVPTMSTQALPAPGRPAIQYDKPTLDHLRSALGSLDPDCDEKTWKLHRIAPLVHLAKSYPDDAPAYKELAREWSRGDYWTAPSKVWHLPKQAGQRTAEQEFEWTWARLMAEPPRERPVTVGTLFKHARDLGWSYDRRTATQLSPEIVVPKAEGQKNAPPVASPPAPQSPTPAPAQAPTPAPDKATVGGNMKTDGATTRAYKEHKPWPEPVLPSALLSEISVTIRRYLIISPEQADAVALWVAHTFFIEVVDTSPLALIDAPERACAKTLLLNIMAALSCRSLPAANASVSAIFRAIAHWGCSLFIDEADTFFKDNKELHGVINAGYKRGGVVLRSEAVADSYEPKTFSVYGPKALAGIRLSKHLPDSTMSRGIVFAMRRKLNTEKVERMRAEAFKVFDVLAAKLARFAQDYADAVRDARPTLPDELSDRAQDNWEPLLMVASGAGKEWVVRGEAAAIKLSAAVEVQGSASNDLLADIREVVADWALDTIKTVELIDKLCVDGDMGWGSYNRGQKISARQLAKYLAAYQLAPRTVRQRDGSTPKGYVLTELQAVFARYLKPVEGDSDDAGSLDVAATAPQTLGMPPTSGDAVSGTSADVRFDDDDLLAGF